MVLSLRRWFTTVQAVVIASSLPLILSSAGYFTNGVGFQGILNHPQAFGVYLAPVTALLVADTFGGSRASPVHGATLPVAAY